LRRCSARMRRALSASTIARLKEVWLDEHEHWRKRDLSAKRYVYVWADGIYLQARLEDTKQCILVIIGATPEGKKELLGFTDGARAKSAQDWRETAARFAEPRSGGRARTRRRRRRAWLLEGARRAVADHTRATLLGAQDRQRPQQTAEEPAAEGQAVITGDLDGRGRARDAEAAFDAFTAAYELKYDKAAECLAKDRQALLAFYDFPAEHWKHLRTSKPDREHLLPPCGTARSARRAASRIRRRSRWCSSWSMLLRKAGAGSMGTTSCPSSFKVSGSPTGSKSPPTRRPRKSQTAAA